MPGDDSGFLVFTFASVVDHAMAVRPRDARTTTWCGSLSAASRG
jgi:hypothetical protein